MPNISPAPISSPLNSKTYQLWFESIGRLLNAISNVKNNASKLNYVISGSIVHINYKGTGSVNIDLPMKCAVDSIVHVSNNTTLTITTGSKQLVLPAFSSELIVQGFYFTNA